MAMEVDKAGDRGNIVTNSERLYVTNKSQPVTSKPITKGIFAAEQSKPSTTIPVKPNPAKPTAAARTQNSKPLSLKDEIKNALDGVLEGFQKSQIADSNEADFDQKNIKHFYRVLLLGNAIEALVAKAGKMRPPFTNLPNPADVNHILNLIHDVYAKDPSWNDIYQAIVSVKDGLIRTAIKQLDEAVYGPNQKLDIKLESNQAKAIIKFAADAVMEEKPADRERKLKDFIESGVDNLDLHKMDVLVAIAEQCMRRGLPMPEGPETFVGNASKPIEFEKLPLPNEAKP
jgi:hypothetical protein